MTIDLGYAVEPPAEAPPPPVSRAWGAVVVAVAVLLLTGASAPAVVRETARISVGDRGIFALDGDTLYAMRDDGVTAYDAPAGTRRWTAAGEGADRETAYGDVVVLSSAACGPPGPGGARARTVAHDRRSGRVLWQRDASTFPTSAGNPLVITLSGGPSDRCVAPNGDLALDGTLRVAALAPATGAVVWQAGFSRGTGLAVDFMSPSWMAVVDPGGALSILDLRTGVRSAVFQTVQTNSLRMIAIGDVLAVAQVNYPRTRQIIGSVGGDATVIPSYVVEGDPGPPRVDLTAYDGRSLTRLWQTSVTDGIGGFVSERCGTDLCVVGNQTVAIDLIDGRVDWTAAPEVYRDLGPGRLMVEPSTDYRAGIFNRGITMADQRTGHRVLSLPTWHPIAVDGTRLLIGQTSVDGSRTLLAWLDGTHPAPFAVFPGEIDDGELVGPSFAFQVDGQVHLMDVA